MGELESSFRRLSLRLERAACLSSWAGSVEVDGSGVEAVEEWLRYDGEGRVETSDMMEQKKGLREDSTGTVVSHCGNPPTTGRCRVSVSMPLDGHAFLVNQGWSGAGNGLRNGSISRPISIPQKRTLAGIGKDRDEAFPFWDQ
jgi:hypothetical protein